MQEKLGRRRCVSSIVAAALVIGIAPFAQARTLYWEALDTQAELDRNGRLHVVERHTMVFDGDWNGGERRFRVEGGQQLKLLSLFEVDAVTGIKKPLHDGDLASSGGYRLLDGDILRWRARQSTDPPFSNAKRIYEIEYVLSGIVARKDDTYRLDHDFAFPSRSGPILHFSASLSLGSPWQSDQGQTVFIQRDNLAPGQSAVLNLSLRFLGAGSPSALAPSYAQRAQNAVAAAFDSVFIDKPELWRYLLCCGVVAFAFATGIAWYRHEKRVGKFVSLVSREQIDRAWLDQHLLMHKPEYVGAAWDLETSANEVAAVLARMTQEGKLKSSIENRAGWFRRGKNLHLTLLCDRSSLRGYERKLIDALFVSGGNSTSTSTDEVRDYYRTSGFDPAKFLRAVFDPKLKRLKSGSTSVPVPTASKLLTAVLFVLSMLSILLSLADRYQRPLLIFVLAPLAAALLMGKIAAAVYRNAADDLFTLAREAVAIVLLAMIVFGVGVMARSYSDSIWLAVAFAFATAGVVNSIFNGMRYRDSVDALRFRRALAAARRYFIAELKSAAPRLEDAWYPYVLAFGLGANVDRWSKAHGAARTDRSFGVEDDDFSDIGASTVGRTSWTGGGGRFGGGGASGSWATAVSGIAASIAAPASDDSGGGSSGGGGGSSGGGGGGGW